MTQRATTSMALRVARRASPWRETAQRQHTATLTLALRARMLFTATTTTCRFGMRTFASRSASAVASVGGDAIAADGKRRSVPALNTLDTAAPVDTSNLLDMLDQSIAERQPGQALAYYNCLELPPSALTSQKLAILLAKQDSLHQTRRAFEILQAVYGSPEFEVDDYTQLASIFVVDACLRHKLLAEATEIFDHAHSSEISLDISAYDSLLRALVEAGKPNEANEILESIVSKNQVILQEQTFQPLLLQMMKRGQYDEVIAVIDHGRTHGVKFTFETYDPLVEMGEEVDDSENEELWDTLEKFMTYINDALEEDGLTALSEDDDDDDGNMTIEVGYDDDDDDDDHDNEDFDNNRY